jgi:hypothetical protein
MRQNQARAHSVQQTFSKNTIGGDSTTHISTAMLSISRFNSVLRKLRASGADQGCSLSWIEANEDLRPMGTCQGYFRGQKEKSPGTTGLTQKMPL